MKGKTRDSSYSRKGRELAQDRPIADFRFNCMKPSGLIRTEFIFIWLDDGVSRWDSFNTPNFCTLPC